MKTSWRQDVILRAASLIAPAERRGEWIEDWRSELWYVPHGERTRFCLGALRDALWLRQNASRQATPLESPVGCLAFLALLAALSSLISVWLPAPATVPASHLRLRDLPAGWAVMLIFTSVFMAAMRLVTGPAAAGCHLAGLSRLRLAAFLALKIALVQPTVFCGLLLMIWILPVVPIAPQLGVLAAWMLSFRWVLADQRRRCPVCLRLLTRPVRIGTPSQTLLEWYGAESVCSRGHGLLHTPETSASYSARPQWHGFDESWRGLFHDA